METEQIKKSNPAPSCIYGLGFLGAAIFYISQATSFGMGLVGVLKALVWPAFMVYEVFSQLITS